MRCPAPPFATLLVAGVLAGARGGAAAAPLRVPEEYPSVTEALRASGPDDRIELAPGIYSPSRTGEEFPLVLSGGRRTLQGAGAGRTVLDAEGRAGLLLFRDGDASVVADLALSGAFVDGEGAAVRVEEASPELVRLLWAGNEAAAGGGALLVRGGSPRVENGALTGNGGEGPTIRLVRGSLLVDHVTLHANGGAALEVRSEASLMLRSSIVSRPGDPAGPAVGLLVVGGGGLGAILLEENLFAECFDGTVALRGDAEEILEGILEDGRRAGGLREGDPLFEDPGRGDLHLRSGSPARRGGEEAAQLGAFGGPRPLDLSPGGPGEELLSGEGAGLLGPSVPNPFAPRTTIHFVVKEAGPVDLAVYNVLGQRVRTLHNGELRAGEHTRAWDGRDDAGADLPPGIYFVRITQGGITESQRLVLVR